MPRSHLAAVLTLAAGFSPAQDMVGVDWGGGLYTVDSATGATTQIGLGVFGMNSLCRDGNGVLWSNGGFHPLRFLARVDPVALTVVPMFPSFDVRALATGPGSTLYAIMWEPSGNAFYRIDTVTGVHTFVAHTGSAGVQGMTTLNGIVYAWDVNFGLGTIDPTTGVFVDVPGSPLGSLQWLAVSPAGQLIGGGTWYGIVSTLFTVDPATGGYFPYASTPLLLRGAEVSQFAAPFGTGCDGGSGPVTLSVVGSARPGTLLTTRSLGHGSALAVLGVPGLLAVGANNTAYGGMPLPLSLDPVFGTSGCSLYTSADATVFGPTVNVPPAMLQFTFAIPPGFQHTTFYVQHFALDQVPGGLSASNGVAVRIAD